MDKNFYLRYFFGPQADYYDSVAEDLHEGTSRFNIAAFFLGVFWMAYRKMYVYTAALYGFLFAEGLAENWLIPELSQTYGYMVASNLVIGSIIGFFGNRLYIGFARRRVAQLIGDVPADAPPTPELVARLRRAGGVSWVGPVVVFAVMLLNAVAYIFF